jgi:F-type H+-transporting ATPase subunit b
VLTAVVIRSGEALQVQLFPSESKEDGKPFNPEECAFKPEAPTATECDPGPSPIVPEMKELAWGAGSFIVFALLMRFFLFPRLKKGMDSRYNSIREGHENADATRATLETERQAAITAANARIATQREAAMAAAEAARAAGRSQVESAVVEVVSSAVEIATGKRPDGSAVSRAVADAMSAGVR